MLIMGQSDILEVLKNNKKWLSVSEISKEIKINPSNVNNSLRQMLKLREIKRRVRKKTNIIYYEYHTY